MLPACALLGHVHLVEWLLRDVDEPATVEQAADALAVAICHAHHCDNLQAQKLAGE